MENIEFDLAGTPCQHVIDDDQFSFYPERLGDHFPEWSEEEGGAESFIGIPVFAPSDGRLVGHIGVYDNKPMRPDVVVESMFGIIAARASISTNWRTFRASAPWARWRRRSPTRSTSR